MPTTVRPWPNPPSGGTTLHHITDSHVGYSDPYTKTPWDKQKVMAMADDVNSGFIRHITGMVHTGDITDDGGGTGPGEGAQDGNAIEWLNRLYSDRPDIPKVIAPGNHDLWDRIQNLGSGLAYSSAAWEHAYGLPANGVTDIGDVRVVHFSPPTMDINEDSRWEISTGRLQWIDQQAKATSRPVVLATHFPLPELNLQNGLSSPGPAISPQSELDQVIESNSNIIGFLSGHRHLAASYVRVASVLQIGSRNIVHLCGPSVAFSLHDGGAAYAQPFAPQFSLYVSILDTDRWQVRLRSHTPARWADFTNGYRVIELDRKTGERSNSNGRIPVMDSGRWDADEWDETNWDW